MKLMMSLQAAPLTKLYTNHVTERYNNSNNNSSQTTPAALTYWQSLFSSEQLSPPQYRYLFPHLDNVDNTSLKDMLTYKLTEEMNLMAKADWSGMNAVGMTAFWLKVLSEPKVAQLRNCKLLFVNKLVELLSGTELITQSEEREKGETTLSSSKNYFIHSPYFNPTSACGSTYSSPSTSCFSQVRENKASSIVPQDRPLDRLSSLVAGAGEATPSTPVVDTQAMSAAGNATPGLTEPENIQLSVTAAVTVKSAPLVPKVEQDRTALDDMCSGSSGSISEESRAETIPDPCSAAGKSNGVLAYNDEQSMAATFSSAGLTSLPDSLLYQEDGKPLSATDDSQQMEEGKLWTETVEGGASAYSCRSCHYVSTYKSRIKQHIRSVHSFLKPYKCDFCDHTTAIRASLTKHINAVHRRLKPFSCALCSYTCNLKRSLEVHMTGFHQKQYKHTCPHCEYAASAKNVVDIHIRAVHTKSKPYKCPHCDYSTAYPQYIPKHIAAVHDRQKPFACPHCPYRSSYKTYLQKHCDAVHNNIKPFSCPHCPYVTSYSQYLNKHISAVHKDEKPHKCPLCQFRCAYKQYISKHIELVHSGKNIGESDKCKVEDMEQSSADDSAGNVPHSKNTLSPHEPQTDCLNPCRFSSEEDLVLPGNNSLSYGILTGSGTSSSDLCPDNTAFNPDTTVVEHTLSGNTLASTTGSTVWPGMP